MDIEVDYNNLFSILKINGGLINDWGNVYKHCLTEGRIANIVSEIFNLSKEEKDILISAAILHDWYKKHEIHKLKKNGIEGIISSSEESYKGLLELGINKRVVDIAHSVGSFVLNDVDSYDLSRKLMHYIDDICDGDKIVKIQDRIIKLKSLDKYKEINQYGYTLYGKSLFDKQLEVGLQIENELSYLLGGVNIFDKIKDKYESIYYRN